MVQKGLAMRLAGETHSGSRVDATVIPRKQCTLSGWTRRVAERVGSGRSSLTTDDALRPVVKTVGHCVAAGLLVARLSRGRGEDGGSQEEGGD